MMRRRGQRPCTYCGKLAFLTRDHVPPKRMFPSNSPNLITVPACLVCNRLWSKDDEHVRAAVGLRREVENNPAIQELLPAIIRGVQRAGLGGSTGSIVKSMEPMPLFTPAGVFAGFGGSYMPDDTVMSRFAGRVVKGLYFHEHRARMPDEMGVVSYVIANFQTRDAESIGSLRRVVAFAAAGKRTVVHTHVFWYAYRATDDRPDVTVWLMLFYGHSPILSFVMPRADHRTDRPIF